MNQGNVVDRRKNKANTETEELAAALSELNKTVTLLSKIILRLQHSIKNKNTYVNNSVNGRPPSTTVH